MASPSMANRTSSSSAIKTIAWPSCSFRWGDLVRVFGAIDRISSDDDLVSDNLLDQRSERLEVKPERHFERLVPIGRNRVEATRRRRIEWQLASRGVGNVWRAKLTLIATHARVGDEDPTRI